MPHPRNVCLRHEVDCAETKKTVLVYSRRTDTFVTHSNVVLHNGHSDRPPGESDSNSTTEPGKPVIPFTVTGPSYRVTGRTVQSASPSAIRLQNDGSSASREQAGRVDDVLSGRRRLDQRFRN